MKSGKSNPVFRDDYKRIRQSICMIFQQPLDYSYFVSDPFIIQPEQHHTSMRPLFAVDFLTEILVRVGGDMDIQVRLAVAFRRGLGYLRKRLWALFQEGL